MRSEVNQTTVNEGLWDKRKTARFLSISTKTLDRWLYEKRGPRGLRVGAQIRFRPTDVHAFLDSCQTVGGLSC